MKTKLTIFPIALILIVISTGTLLAFNKNRKVPSVTAAGEQAGNLSWTRSLYYQVDASDQAMQKLIYTSYLSGFLDAMQLEVLKDVSAERFLKENENVTLGELIILLSRFYKENPDLRETKPITILTVAIPRMKKGLSPLPKNSEAGSLEDKTK